MWAHRRKAAEELAQLAFSVSQAKVARTLVHPLHDGSRTPNVEELPRWRFALGRSPCDAATTASRRDRPIVMKCCIACASQNVPRIGATQTPCDTFPSGLRFDPVAYPTD
jgi:hypothetical protein